MKDPRATTGAKTKMIPVSALPSLASDAGNASFVEAWLRWREDQLLPRRSEMNLRDIATLLPRVGMLEIVGPDIIRMRVAGTALRDVYGIEMTGRNLKEITAPDMWPARSARYRALVAQPCGSFYRRRDVMADGKVMTYETVALPIEAGQSAARHMLFCVGVIGSWPSLKGPSGPQSIPLPMEFQYVDIGAGTPVDSKE